MRNTHTLPVRTSVSQTPGSRAPRASVTVRSKQWLSPPPQLHCITFITFQYITLHYIAIQSITLYCITLHYIIYDITLHYITLHEGKAVAVAAAPAARAAGAKHHDERRLASTWVASQTRVST